MLLGVVAIVPSSATCIGASCNICIALDFSHQLCLWSVAVFFFLMTIFFSRDNLFKMYISLECKYNMLQFCIKTVFMR